MNNNYVSKEILSRASRRWIPNSATERTKAWHAMRDATAAYRATWGWLVIAALLAAGILAVLSAIYE